MHPAEKQDPEFEARKAALEQAGAKIIALPVFDTGMKLVICSPPNY